MMLTRLSRRLIPVAVFLTSSAAFAIKVPTGTPNFDLNINVLAQARARGSWDGDPPKTAADLPSPNRTFDTDFYIRRARLITSGTAYTKFTFYLMLDTPNLGIHGNYGTSTILQDLHFGYEPTKEIDIERGLLYTPLSHLAINSSSGTSAIDKNTGVLFYNNQTGLRQTGIHIRGLLFDKLIYFRGGVFEGLHRTTTATDTATNRVNSGINPNGRPLAAGMLRLNLIGSESGYAMPTMYMDGKSRASIGVGAHYQPKGSNTPIRGTPTAVNDYVAFAGDLFVDLALPGDQEATLQADVYRFDWGAGSDKTGYGSSLEAAYRIGQFSPEVNGYWFNSDSKQNSALKIAGGINYFIKGHSAKIGAEFWHIKSGVNLDAASALHLVIIQGQVYF